MPKAPKGKADNQALVKAVYENQYEPPVTFKLTLKSMSASGFLKLVGVLQILSSLLILLPRTRLIGLLALLPVTTNIFCLHFFMDNRPGENLETGAYLALNLLLLAYYLKSHLKVLLLFERPLLLKQN